MGDWSSIWNSVSGFFGSAYESAEGAYKMFRKGYEFGDIGDVGSGYVGSDSIFYKAGDYIEDVFDLGSKAAEVKGFIDRTTGAKSFTAPSPREFQVSASRYGTPSGGSYRSTAVDYAKAGYADPRVQTAAAKVAQAQLESFKSTQRALGMTTRGGRYTMGIQTNLPIRVGTKTKLPKIPESVA